MLARTQLHFNPLVACPIRRAIMAQNFPAVSLVNGAGQGLAGAVSSQWRKRAQRPTPCVIRCPASRRCALRPRLTRVAGLVEGAQFGSRGPCRWRRRGPARRAKILVRGVGRGVKQHGGGTDYPFTSRPGGEGVLGSGFEISVHDCLAAVLPCLFDSLVAELADDIR